MLPHPDTLIALFIILIWGAGMWFATIKYLAAHRAKKRIDQIIWFIVWCLLVTMIEWIVLFLFVISCNVVGVGCIG